MGKAIDDRTYRHTNAVARGPRERDWRKSMSDNVALALIVYTALQIFVQLAVKCCLWRRAEVSAKVGKAYP